jgi:ribosomal protein L32
MAPLTKRRHSTRRGGKRKAAINLTLPTVTRGKGEEPLHIPHRAYKQDGYYVYRGKKIAKA